MAVETFSFRNDEIIIARDAFACAMGYGTDAMPLPLLDAIEEVQEVGRGLCHVNGGYKIIESIIFDRQDFTVLVDSQSFSVKKIVFGQIKRSERIAIFACTAGEEIINESRRLMQEGEQLKGYVYDVFGSLVVEEAMDRIQESLREKMLMKRLNITNRYSPGYCGWNVSEQKKLFGLLPEGFCGIELTDSCLMHPIKSVSGIIGIGKSAKFSEYTCNLCDEKDCLYRNLRDKTTMPSQQRESQTCRVTK